MTFLLEKRNSNDSPKTTESKPISRATDHPAISAVRMALIMAIAGAVFVASWSFAIVLFHTTRGNTWIITEAKLALTIFPLFCAIVGSAVGIIFGTKKKSHKYPLMMGGLSGGLAGPVGMVAVAASQLVWNLQSGQGGGQKFGVADTLILLSVLGIVLGVCTGTTAGWAFSAAQRSLSIAICRAAICAAVIGLLLACKG